MAAPPTLMSPALAMASSADQPFGKPLTPRIHSPSVAADLLDADAVQYVVVLQKGRHGVCLNLAGVNMVRVVGFRALPDGTPGPAEASGKISVGDVLLGVNGTAVNKLKDVVELLGSSGQVVELRFQKADIISPGPGQQADGPGSGLAPATSPVGDAIADGAPRSPSYRESVTDEVAAAGKRDGSTNFDFAG